MMPSATFQDTLEGPHLVRDDLAKGRVRQDLERATQRVKAAEEKLGPEAKEKPEVTVMAYEAMYACAKALLHAEGYRTTHMGALLIALDQLYVKRGRLDVQDLERFEQALRVTPGTAGHVQHARHLVDRCEALVAGKEARG